MSIEIDTDTSQLISMRHFASRSGNPAFCFKGELRRPKAANSAKVEPPTDQVAVSLDTHCALTFEFSSFLLQLLLTFVRNSSPVTNASLIKRSISHCTDSVPAQCGPRLIQRFTVEKSKQKFPESKKTVENLKRNWNQMVDRLLHGYGS